MTCDDRTFVYSFETGNPCAIDCELDPGHDTDHEAIFIRDGKVTKVTWHDQ